MFKENPILFADSYKYSQPSQYKKNINYMFDYLESRGGYYPVTVFTGLQYLIKRYFLQQITAEDVEEAREILTKHGEPFEYEGWMKVVNKHNGFIPIRIKAVKEGSVIPVKNVLATIESTDPELFWLVGWAETILMKIWYSTTIATKSYFVRLMLEGFAERYSDNKDGVAFQFHNFGDRGATTVEAAAVGGMAHLTQFMGTDNTNSIRYGRYFYNEDMIGFSIPASEHSTVTSWGKEQEFDMIDAYLENSKGKFIIACVLDSYDIYNATRKVTSGEFKRKIESDDYPTFVMRPDSGDAVEVVKEMLQICIDNDVACNINSKNLKVMKKYRIIYGDGITPNIIADILNEAVNMGFAPDNFAFGSGGDLMQNVNRDTNKFAIKCSAVTNTEGEMIEVFKDPITDPGKKSKKGILDLFYNKKTKQFLTLDNKQETPKGFESILEVVYENGVLLKDYTFSEIRANSRGEI